MVQRTRVERPIEDLAEILGARPPDWLAPFASIAVYAGEAAAERRSGAGLRAPADARSVSIDLRDLPAPDDSEHVDAGVQLHTHGFRWAFPAFEGRIVLERESAGSCVVSIEGSYDLPPAAAEPDGRARAALAAESIVAVLLRTLRDAVEEQARSDA
jgi:hypothetical protein